jgi:hypothetical protein
MSVALSSRWDVPDFPLQLDWKVSKVFAATGNAQRLCAGLWHVGCPEASFPALSPIYCPVCWVNESECFLCGRCRQLDLPDHVRSARTLCRCQKASRTLLSRFPTQCLACFASRSPVLMDQSSILFCTTCGRCFEENSDNSVMQSSTCPRCLRQAALVELRTFPMARSLLKIVVGHVFEDFGRKKE